MSTAQDVTGKLIALRAWLAEARDELEREMDREGAGPWAPGDDARRHWQSKAVGKLECLCEIATDALVAIEVAYDLSLFTTGDER